MKADVPANPRFTQCPPKWLANINIYVGYTRLEVGKHMGDQLAHTPGLLPPVFRERFLNGLIHWHIAGLIVLGLSDGDQPLGKVHITPLEGKEFPPTHTCVDDHC